MLDIVNHEEIRRILLLIPQLVDDHERRDPAFPSKVKQWLSEAERVLSGNRMTVAADVAALRSTLIAAERGIVPSGLVIQGRPTRRRTLEAAAVDVLRRAEELVSSSIAADTARFAKAEQLARELVAFAARKGIVRELKATSRPETAQTMEFWKAVVNDKELGPYATQLTASIRAHDLSIVLDRALSSTPLGS